MKNKKIERPLAEGLTIYKDKKADCIVSYCANYLSGDEMKEVATRLSELHEIIINAKNKNHETNT